MDHFPSGVLAYFPSGARKLVALCSAALRPTRHTWDAFLAHLQRLEKSGTITSDESLAIVANELTQALLVDAELTLDDDPPDPDLLSEVVERVRSRYREEADALVLAVKDAAETKVAAVHHDAETRVGVIHGELGAERESRRQLQLRVEGRADGLALVLGWLVCAVIAAAIVAGSALSFMQVSGSGTPWKLWVGGLGGLVSFAGLYTLLFGGSVLDLQRFIRLRSKVKIQSWLLGQ